MKTLATNAQIKPDALRGKTAVITGGGRGIGKAIATVLAKAGACSVLVVRDRTVGEQAASELSKQGYQADFGVADVTEPAQISMLVLDLTQRHPVVDVLVNNAGIFLDEDRAMRPSQIDPLILQRTLSVNLLGPISMCNAFVPLLTDGGRIINVSSSMGQLAGESDGYGPAYCVSKVGLNMYTQLLAADLRARRIMVDAFAPGWGKPALGGSGAPLEPETAAKQAL